MWVSVWVDKVRGGTASADQVILKVTEEAFATRDEGEKGEEYT